MLALYDIHFLMYNLTPRILYLNAHLCSLALYCFCSIFSWIIWWLVFPGLNNILLQILGLVFTTTVVFSFCRRDPQDKLVLPRQIIYRDRVMRPIHPI